MRARRFCVALTWQNIVLVKRSVRVLLSLLLSAKSLARDLGFNNPEVQAAAVTRVNHLEAQRKAKEDKIVRDIAKKSRNDARRVDLQERLESKMMRLYLTWKMKMSLIRNPPALILLNHRAGKICWHTRLPGLLSLFI
jgi:hypothetical protein